MSSTTNVQNVVTNILRPTYSFDANLGGFVARVELSNIDNIYSSNLTTTIMNAYDSNNNVYLGGGFLPYASIFSNHTNSNTTLVGYGVAGLTFSNVANSVFMGYNAVRTASNVSNVIAIGANTVASSGSNNIFVGTGTGVSTGNGNIYIGNGISNTTATNSLLVGASNKILMYGDTSSTWVGFGYPTKITGNDTFDVSGSIGLYGRVGVNMDATMYSTMSVNGTFQVGNTNGTMAFAYDASSYPVVTLSNGNPLLPAYLNVTGFTKSASGYSSIRGYASNVSNIPVTLTISNLVAGQCVVSVTCDTSTNYAFSNFAITKPFSTISIFSNVSGVALTVQSNLIRFSNTEAGTSLNFNYNVTYFPTG